MLNNNHLIRSQVVSVQVIEWVGDPPTIKRDRQDEQPGENHG